MEEVSKPSDGERFTREELIRSELAGKVAASGAYDAILWKVRAGYVIVLYGALTIAGATKTLNSPWVTVILVTGFSLGAGFIDYQFLRAKLRVVADLNKLMEIVWRIAGGTLELGNVNELPRLLRMSGEEPSSNPEAGKLFRKWQNAGLLFILYGLPPLLSVSAAIVSEFRNL
jgi:hypothetical protein